MFFFPSEDMGRKPPMRLLSGSGEDRLLPIWPTSDQRAPKNPFNSVRFEPKQ